MIAIRKIEQTSLDETIAELLQEIRFAPERGKGIFIKPNVVIPTADAAIITSPAVVESLIKYFSGYRIIIGERSAVGVDTYRALERSGYVALAKRYRVELVDLSQVPRVNVQWERGTLSLPQVIFEHTYINVAKLKTHFLTTVSLCAKNQKGLLSVKDAKKFHFIGVDRAIRALGEAVTPDLNLIDGIRALEGNGPTTFGKARKPGIVIAGNDLFEIDTVACKIMGIDPGEVKHLIPKEIPPHPEDQIRTLTTPFLKPSLEESLTVESIRFHNIRHCCSGCILAIDSGITWLMTEKKELWMKLLRKLSSERFDIYLGTGNHLTPEVHTHIRAFGSCSAHFARSHQLPYLKGCPPSPEEIISLFGLE